MKTNKVRLDGVKRILISGEYIRLDSLLKYAAIASTGGEAKIMIQSGNVYIGGRSCMERGKKTRPGDVVRYRENLILVKKKAETC